MKNKNLKQDDPLENLADALTEDIINTPDDEVLREVEEDYGDPRALTNRFDQLLEHAEKQVFATARPATFSQAQSSVLDWPQRLLDWLSTLFGNGQGRSVFAAGTQFQFFSVNRMVWAGAAALIVLIAAPVLLYSTFETQLSEQQNAQIKIDQQNSTAQTGPSSAEIREAWNETVRQQEARGAKDKEGPPGAAAPEEDDPRGRRKLAQLELETELRVDVLLSSRQSGGGKPDIKHAADRGSPDAQFYLGVLYVLGEEGLPKDTKAGVNLLRKAAEQNVRDAQYYLGRFYQVGYAGLSADVSEGQHWLKIAANNGDRRAQAIISGVEPHLSVDVERGWLKQNPR